MYFRVKRTDNIIDIFNEIQDNDILKMSSRDHMKINDEVIIKEIKSAQEKGLSVSFNTATKKLTTRVDKYRDIPNTDIKRVQAVRLARVQLESITDAFELIDYVNYIDANNILSSNGFFITDENREEMYLNILEADNESLIDALEEFLTIKDKLTVVKSAKRKYDEIVERVHNTTEDDINIADIFK